MRAICGPTVGAGHQDDQRHGAHARPLELRHSKLIILWGTNTRLTNRHLWPTIEAARADGAQVVVIDPIRTITADAADWFIQPLPGTDIALMLAMMHVLIRDGLVDHEWVADHTVGFDELAAHVAEWTPERARRRSAASTPPTSRRSPTTYGTIRPAAIRTLIGAEHHENGAMFFRTLACLPALVGAWRDRRRRAGAQSSARDRDAVVDDVALTRPDLLAGREPRWINMSRLGEALTDADARPAGRGDDRVELQPAGDRAQRRADRAAGSTRDDLFIVVHEQFLTDTARYADIVLPATTQIEATDVVTAVGAPLVRLERGRDRAARRGVQQQRAVPPAGRGDGLHRARRCSTTTRRARAGARPGRSTSTSCARTGWLRGPLPRGRPAVRRRRIPHAVGQGRAASASALVAMGQPALPTFVPPAEGPLGDPELAARYPLQLMTPEAPHPLPQLQLLARCPSTGRPRAARSSSSTPPTPRPAASPTATAAAVFNDRASIAVPARVDRAAAARRRRRSRSAGGRAITPTAASPTR